MSSIGFAGFFLILMLLFLIPVIFFLITQQNTLKAVQPQNRFMSPGEVWLQLIPLFGIVWQFFVVTRISKSIKKELASSNQFSFEENPYDYVDLESDRPTYQVGMAMAILFTCSILPIPVFEGLCTLAGIICWIVYWVNLSQCKTQIEQQRYAVSQPTPSYDPTSKV